MLIRGRKGILQTQNKRGLSHTNIPVGGGINQSAAPTPALCLYTVGKMSRLDASARNKGRRALNKRGGTVLPQMTRPPSASKPTSSSPMPWHLAPQTTGILGGDVASGFLASPPPLTQKQARKTALRLTVGHLRTCNAGTTLALLLLCKRSDQVAGWAKPQATTNGRSDA